MPSPPSDEPGGRRRGGAVTAGLQYAGLAFEFAGIVVGAVLLGSWLDGRLGSAPWCTLLLTLGGLAGAVRRLIWSLNRPRS